MNPKPPETWEWVLQPSVAAAKQAAYNAWAANQVAKVTGQIEPFSAEGAREAVVGGVAQAYSAPFAGSAAVAGRTLRNTLDAAETEAGETIRRHPFSSAVITIAGAALLLLLLRLK